MPDADTGESIDDYTGPEDAKSISHELRGEMRELTLRMMITGVCTVLLVLVNLIFGGQITGPGTRAPCRWCTWCSPWCFWPWRGRVLPAPCSTA